MIKKLWFFIPIFITVGFFQDYLKVNINHYADTAQQIPGFFQLDPNQRELALHQATPDFPFDYYYSHSKFGALNSMTESGIVRFKWEVAFFFVFVHLALVLWAYRHMNWPKNRLYAAIGFYFLCLAASGGFWTLGKAIGSPQQGYAVARRLLGFLQSPLPLVLTLMAAWLYLKWNPEKT
jgi:hypothetical protein